MTNGSPTIGGLDRDSGHLLHVPVSGTLASKIEDDFWTFLVDLLDILLEMTTVED